MSRLEEMYELLEADSRIGKYFSNRQTLLFVLKTTKKGYQVIMHDGGLRPRGGGKAALKHLHADDFRGYFKLEDDPWSFGGGMSKIEDHPKYPKGIHYEKR